MILSKELKNSIEMHLLQARSKKIVLNIYRIAEEIQAENPSANVALEDIIEYIIQNSGSNFAIEFAPEWSTRKAPSPINGSHEEFLLAADEAYVQ